MTDNEIYRHYTRNFNIQALADLTCKSKSEVQKIIDKQRALEEQEQDKELLRKKKLDDELFKKMYNCAARSMSYIEAKAELGIVEHASNYYYWDMYHKAFAKYQADNPVEVKVLSPTGLKKKRKRRSSKSTDKNIESEIKESEVKESENKVDSKPVKQGLQFGKHNPDKLIVVGKNTLSGKDLMYDKIATEHFESQPYGGMFNGKVRKKSTIKEEKYMSRFAIEKASSLIESTTREVVQKPVAQFTKIEEKSSDSDLDSHAVEDTVTEKPAKRRGRPPKSLSTDSVDKFSNQTNETEKATKRRGRPPKSTDKSVEVVSTEPKKRGRKPKTTTDTVIVEEKQVKRRGRKPKVSISDNTNMEVSNEFEIDVKSDYRTTVTKENIAVAINNLERTMKTAEAELNLLKNLFYKFSKEE